MKKGLLILLIFSTSILYAQKKEEKTKNHNMPISTNLLDMQVEVLKDISGDSLVGGIDYSKVNNFKDLVDASKKDLTPKEKKRYKELYELQKNAPNQKQKDSISKLLQKYLVK